MLNYKFLALFFAALLSQNVVLASGTGIGNADDPVFEFMEATRTSMVETLKFIMSNPDEQAQLCKSLKSNPAQHEFCKNYFFNVVPDILRLSQGEKKTALAMRDEPLYTVLPDGTRKYIVSKTAAGPNGPIEIHWASVKNYNPLQALEMILSEFQHKADFNGNFVKDTEPVGPFATGRELIEALSSSVVYIAQYSGNIGLKFSIRDTFACSIIASANPLPININLYLPRKYQNADLTNYQTSLGIKNISDVAITDFNGDSISLRFTIEEPNNCKGPHAARRSLLQIVRSSRASDGSINQTVLENRTLGYNPMCPNTSADLAIASDRFTFKCQYYGSEGTTTGGRR